MDVLGSIKKNADALQKFQNEINSIIEAVIMENEIAIIELNTEDQLFEQGINTYGVDISDYAPYSEITIEDKKIKGQPYNRVTLRDESDFHDSVFIRYGTDGFSIAASDFKTEDLVKKYGKVLGLTEENKGELLYSYIVPELKNQLNKYFKG